MNLYENRSSYAKPNAQQNLEGRTHYVDDATLRFHKSRILRAKAVDQGMLFALIESYAADMHGRTRLFRHVIFDITGHTIDRPDMEHGHKTRKAAEKAMWTALDGIDAKAVTLAAIDREQANTAAECERMRAVVAGLQS